jgi:cyclin-dependent kinase-like
VDIWAIGCIACEIITGKPLFPGNSDLDQLHKIILSLGALPQYQFEELKKNRRFINFKVKPLFINVSSKRTTQHAKQ